MFVNFLHIIKYTIHKYLRDFIIVNAYEKKYDFIFFNLLTFISLWAISTGHIDDINNNSTSFVFIYLLICLLIYLFIYLFISKKLRKPSQKIF